MSKQFTAIYKKSGKWYLGWIEEIPGVNTQGKTLKETDQMTHFSNLFQKQMLYFLPVFTVFILWKLPAAIALYWLTTSLFSLVQEYIFFKPHIEKT